MWCIDTRQPGLLRTQQEVTRSFGKIYPREKLSPNEGAVLRVSFNQAGEAKLDICAGFVAWPQSHVFTLPTEPSVTKNQPRGFQRSRSARRRRDMAGALLGRGEVQHEGCAEEPATSV